MKIFFGLFLSAFMLLMVSCESRSSIKLMKKNQPEIFKTIKIDQEAFQYVHLSNSGKPIILMIHGSPGSWSNYLHFFKNKVLTQHFELIAFDRMGYGNNRRGVPHPSLLDQILLPYAILKKIKKGRPVILVAHSYGVPVALKLAGVYPDLVNHMILASGSVDPALEKTKFIQRIAKLWGIRHIIPSALDVCNREILGLKEELVLSQQDYNNIHQPIYILHGKKDNLVPIGNVDYLKTKLEEKQLTIKIIDSEGHFILWSHAQLFTEALLKIIQVP